MEIEKFCVVGNLADSAKYAHLHPLLPKAFEFLNRPEFRELPPGRHDIVPGECWVAIEECKLSPVGGKAVEAHRRCIDIHVPISGPETIGIMRMDEEKLALPFDVERDVVLFDAPTEPVEVKAGEFALIFPPYAGHAPCCSDDGRETLVKAVVKIVA